jgi:hypothetical protein
MAVKICAEFETPPHPRMKLFIVLIAVLHLAVSAGRIEAQTLNWGSAAFSDLYDSEGNELDGSFVFELGTFDTSFIPTDENVDFWFANWRVFDTAAYVAENGVFTGTEKIHEVSNYESLFAGLDAYIWVRNGTTPGPQTEWFLARKSTGPDAWVFPNLTPGCCPNGEVTQWSISTLGSEDPVWGNQGGNLGGGEYSVTGNFDLQTHVVPEPASSMMALMAAAVCVLRRRRAHAFLA